MSTRSFSRTGLAVGGGFSIKSIIQFVLIFILVVVVVSIVMTLVTPRQAVYNTAKAGIKQISFKSCNKGNLKNYAKSLMEQTLFSQTQQKFDQSKVEKCFPDPADATKFAESIQKLAKDLKALGVPWTMPLISWIVDSLFT